MTENLTEILATSNGNHYVGLLGAPDRCALVHPAALVGIDVPEDLKWVLGFLTHADAPAEVRRTTLGAIIHRGGPKRGRVGGLLFFLREVGAVSFAPAEPTRRPQP